MWEDILHAVLLAFLTAVAASLPIIIPALRRLIMNTAGLQKVRTEGELADRFDDGVVNILTVVIEELKKRLGNRVPPPAAIVNEALPKVERNFPETIQKLGLNREAVRDYLLARVQRANSLDRNIGPFPRDLET